MPIQAFLPFWTLSDISWYSRVQSGPSWWFWQFFLPIWLFWAMVANFFHVGSYFAVMVILSNFWSSWPFWWCDVYVLVADNNGGQLQRWVALAWTRRARVGHYHSVRDHYSIGDLGSVLWRDLGGFGWGNLSLAEAMEQHRSLRSAPSFAPGGPHPHLLPPPCMPHSKLLRSKLSPLCLLGPVWVRAGHKWFTKPTRSSFYSFL